ncbi:hypothetical protein GCM10007358_12200 [Phocicoccus schoeneichii]|uniref:Telomeric repeat-binding factor 2 n=1 Tax=Phocicoccus schoeneichii TaxID=1812261 RepID=A0A6V7RB52_9BACL|nr:hypothetical protein [Jeotgalicoccus schoeneichii]GGH53147.1 hypothetical protein GCM10007358_12200 [Jeotgalicoccus schoeneichii]CAD2073992.1 Telomeric repeat-binding factor 2 [Jeotgalicoccus schoeneichii]
MKKLLSLLCVMGLSFVLVACSDSSDEKETDTSNEKTETEETSSGSDQAQGTENEDAVYEIGETLTMESYEWEVPYQVTVKAVDITREYNGEDITEYVGNAQDTNNFVVAKTVIKNTSDEPMIPGEYVVPRLGVDMNGNGENFVFELSEEELSKEIEPGEAVELDFVFLENLAHADSEGNFYLHFEGYTDNQKSYKVPTK